MPSLCARVDSSRARRGSSLSIRLAGACGSIAEVRHRRQYNSPMAGSEGQSRARLELHDFIDSVPALAWSALPDGTLDFFNQRFLDYAGLSSDELHRLDWKTVV